VALSEKRCVSRSGPPRRPCLRAAPIIAVLTLFGVALVWADDESDLMEAVRAYLEAEVRADTGRVWEMLAPSSAFRRAFSYEAYEEMTKGTTVRLKRYVIESVVAIQDNGDRVQMPAVDKVASVKVKVVLADQSGMNIERTSIFTFLREGGRWYKG
jgi:hypothetical protein